MSDGYSGLLIGDISGVRGGWSDSISKLLSEVFIDSVQIPCAGEMVPLPTLSSTLVSMYTKHVSASYWYWPSTLSFWSGILSTGEISASSWYSILKQN